jgi:phage FluMu protein Com
MTNTFESIYAQYAARYDLEELDSPNDLANLTVLINNQLLVEQLQAHAKTMADADIVTNAVPIQKISDNVATIVERNLQLERALALDRKTRKAEKTASVADFIKGLKINGREFMDQRLQKIYCPSCNIMVMRIGNVYKHVPFVLKVKCPQCFHAITIKQDEQHPMFDIARSDRAWRDKYPIEIEQPSRKQRNLSAPEDLIIEGDIEDGAESET